MACAAVITAGGSGQRMGLPVRKQYLDLAGIPVLARTVAVFQMHPLIDAIVVTVPAGDEGFCRAEILPQARYPKLHAVVTGGDTRQESVNNGLTACVGYDLVAIHDAARPLVSAATIAATIEAAHQCGAALSCIPVRETVKRRLGRHLETIPREDLWLARTPQTFRTELIIAAHRDAAENGIQGTDDAFLVERMGHPVAVVLDSEENIKITTVHDLSMAEMILGRRSRPAG
jgi:2-C-methyl-D-erythritol 4-phosphate cytidylyltransferase